MSDPFSTFLHTLNALQAMSDRSKERERQQDRDDTFDMFGKHIAMSTGEHGETLTPDKIDWKSDAAKAFVANPKIQRLLMHNAPEDTDHIGLDAAPPLPDGTFGLMLTHYDADGNVLRQGPATDGTDTLPPRSSDPNAPVHRFDPKIFHNYLKGELSKYNPQLAQQYDDAANESAFRTDVVKFTRLKPEERPAFLEQVAKYYDLNKFINTARAITGHQTVSPNGLTTYTDALGSSSFVPTAEDQQKIIADTTTTNAENRVAAEQKTLPKTLSNWQQTAEKQAEVQDNLANRTLGSAINRAQITQSAMHKFNLNLNAEDAKRAQMAIEILTEAGKQNKDPNVTVTLSPQTIADAVVQLAALKITPADMTWYSGQTWAAQAATQAMQNDAVRKAVEQYYQIPDEVVQSTIKDPHDAAYYNQGEKAVEGKTTPEDQKTVATWQAGGTLKGLAAGGGRGRGKEKEPKYMESDAETVKQIQDSVSNYYPRGTKSKNMEHVGVSVDTMLNGINELHGSVVQGHGEKIRADDLGSVSKAKKAMVQAAMELKSPNDAPLVYLMHNLHEGMPSITDKPTAFIDMYRQLEKQFKAAGVATKYKDMADGIRIIQAMKDLNMDGKEAASRYLGFLNSPQAGEIYEDIKKAYNTEKPTPVQIAAALQTIPRRVLGIEDPGLPRILLDAVIENRNRNVNTVINGSSGKNETPRGGLYGIK